MLGIVVTYISGTKVAIEYVKLCGYGNGGNRQAQCQNEVIASSKSWCFFCYVLLPSVFCGLLIVMVVPSLFSTPVS